MAELPYMSVPVADAIADAEGLTNEQLGALERVRRVLWRMIQPDSAAPMLPLEDVIRVSRLGRRWGKAGPALMRRLVEVDGMVSCPVINTRLALARKRRKAKAEAGAKGAEARWSGSEASQNDTSVAPRKPANPLKSPALDPDLLGPAYSNQNHKSGAEGQKLPSGTSLSAEVKAQQDALYRKGVKILMQRTGASRLQATKNINIWLNMMGADADALAALLDRVAEEENLTGVAFAIAVAREAERIERERTKGLSLPLGPVTIQGGRR